MMTRRVVKGKERKREWLGKAMMMMKKGPNDTRHIVWDPRCIFFLTLCFFTNVSYSNDKISDRVSNCNDGGAGPSNASYAIHVI